VSVILDDLLWSKLISMTTPLPIVIKNAIA